METFTASEGVSKPTGVRRRGRPAGKGRTPLSLEERRARNAQYERERRATMGIALADLARAANFNPNMTPVDLLAEVVNFIRVSTQSKRAWDTDALKRCNNNLATQIAALEHQLATEPEQAASVPYQLPQSSQKKRKLQEFEPQCRQSKRFAPDPEPFSTDGLDGHTTFPCQPSPLSTCQPSYDEPSCQLRPMMSTTQPSFCSEGTSGFVPCEGLSPDYCHMPSQGDAKEEISCSDLWADVSDILSAPSELEADYLSSWTVDDLLLEYL